MYLYCMRQGVEAGLWACLHVELGTSLVWDMEVGPGLRIIDINARCAKLTATSKRLVGLSSTGIITLAAWLDHEIDAYCPPVCFQDPQDCGQTRSK